MSVRENLPTRDNYPYQVLVTTRWSDNDVYGHVNNVTYYSYFDTAANHLLMNEGGLDIQNADVIGVVAESHCRYFSSVAYPETLTIGVAVKKLGTRSVTYDLAVFSDRQDTAVAVGDFVHVFVNRASNKAVPIPEKIRAALESISAEPPE